jgi:seryl-tRNA synthetase
MLDIKWIRENPEEFDRLLSLRGLKARSEEILSLDEEKRQLITLIQQLQHVRKEKSKELGLIKNKASREFEQTKKDAEDIKEKLEELEKEAAKEDKLAYIMDRLPNLPAEGVPTGEDEFANVEVRKHGEIRQINNPKQHFELGENLGMMDFVQTAKISGSRFVTLKSDLAKLERALASFMIDIHTKDFGFTEVAPPYLVRNEAMYGTGQLPNLAEDSFETTNGYRLIPTSEISLANLVADMIIPREQLPMRFVAHTPCFRSEAGSAGKDTRGMFRVHQFNKVELVVISAPDESDDEHEYITNAAETILKRLELPYRVMLLSTGDMGFCARKTYDLEVWLPGQNRYREISSCSNCGDFQARRTKSRYKEFGSTQTTFVHTLNGSGLAVGRTLIAILENYQNEDGSITIPKALVSYMGGQEKIDAKG